MKIAGVILGLLLQLVVSQCLAVPIANSFAFPTITGVVPDTLVSSAPITVSGITAPADISVSKGEYSVNSSLFTTLPGSVQNGDRVVLRQRAANGFYAARTARLTIGGTSATFTVVTMPSYAGNGTALYFFSEPNDYIGQGEAWLMDAKSMYTISGQVSGQTAMFSAIQPNYANWWYLEFASAAGQLKQGKYLNAQRWPFQAPGHPGLSASGNGRGCNTLTGEFDVLEVAYNASGAITKLAVNFEQHCEDMKSDLYGQLRYRSSLPINIIVRGKRHDYQADGGADTLWRNPVTGENVMWNSASSAAPRGVTALGSTWRVAGIGDFSGDGRADILWRNSTTGENAIWKSANSAALQAIAAIPTAWSVAYTGDFDGNGKSDILWRDPATGGNVIWKSANSATPQAVSGMPAPWVIAQVADFNGDGKADILWRNPVTGGNNIWKSANSATRQIVAGAAAAWTVAPGGDFDGDGKADILWRNPTTGANVVWKSASSLTTRAVAGMPAPWIIAQVGDFNGDGKDDILWRNPTTGGNEIWRSANSTASQAVTALSPAWTVAK